MATADRNGEADSRLSLFNWSIGSFAGSLAHAWNDYPLSITYEYDNPDAATFEHISSYEQRERLRAEAQILRGRLTALRGQFSAQVIDEIDNLIVRAVGLLSREAPSTSTLTADLADEIRDAVGRLPLTVITNETTGVDGGAEVLTASPITKEAAGVLKYLVSGTNVLATLDDIEVAVKVSRTTAQKARRELIRSGYAHCPHGQKKGLAATSNGMDFATKLSTNSN